MCYITADNLMIMHQAVLPILVRLENATSERRTLIITNFDDGSLCISLEENILLLSQATKALIENHCKPFSFLSNVFHRYDQAFVNRLYAGLLEQDEKKFPILAKFLSTNV